MVPTRLGTCTTVACGQRRWWIIWADEDGTAKTGLHANFKLSQSGETVLLIDTDARANAILDSVKFNRQKANVSLGRYPNGSKTLRQMKPSPGQNNKNGA